MPKKIILCADGTWNTPHGPTALPDDTSMQTDPRTTNGSRSLGDCQGTASFPITPPCRIP
jgi:hypothetical protein